jgi:drug/metabolite transporter (DMT)-like permease
VPGERGGVASRQSAGSDAVTARATVPHHLPGDKRSDERPPPTGHRDDGVGRHAGRHAVIALLLALASSASYGASDFLASRVTKRLSPVLLVLYSQAAQGLVLLAVVLAVGQPVAGAGLAWGAVAGAVIAVGLVAYYQALATGPTAVVAPLAASGAVIPVLVDLALGRFPGVLALAGVLVVGAGIVVTTVATSREPAEEPTPPCRGAMLPGRGRARALVHPPRSIPLALLTAVLFGAFFLVVDRGSAAAGAGVLWVALGIQLGALPVALVAALSAGGLESLKVPRQAVLLPAGVLTGLNLVGDAALSYAVTGAELAVVSVLASLAPVVTVLLARAFTAERLTRLQGAGVALAVVGTLVVATGR